MYRHRFMDAVILSRIQFALTSGFHYIYPPLSIGLGLMLVIFEGIYLKTKNPLYKEITKFWTKIFGLTFALGVATGIVQLFGFGMNWGRYSKFVGDVFGSALGAEGIFAFFLEAGFLGVMLFGWDRVSARFHYMATILVAFGAHFSALWIVVANSWMQTPAGFRIEGTGDNARAIVTDFWAMIFNPSAVDRVVHVVVGCWLAGIFLVLSVTGYYMLKRRHPEFVRVNMKIGLIVAFVTLVLQLISADSTARGVAENQPPKLAAIEGIYKTEPYTPITILGWTDNETKEVHGLRIPGGLSFLVSRDFEKPVPGLDQFPREDWPPVGIVFQTYHIMVAMWAAMFMLTCAALYYWKKKTLQNKKWVLWGLIASVTFPQIANQTGWMTAEIGRQPWVVWGLLRTSQGTSKSVVASQVLTSICVLLGIYALLFFLFMFLLDRKIKHGPEDAQNEEFRDPDTKGHL
jgi:cytochrome d ubiquinol oxidase subunit I